jgi:hypothetical protein
MVARRSWLFAQEVGAGGSRPSTARDLLCGTGSHASSDAVLLLQRLARLSAGWSSAKREDYLSLALLLRRST